MHQCDSGSHPIENHLPAESEIGITREQKAGAACWMFLKFRRSCATIMLIFDMCRWKKLQARDELEKDAFDKATWGFLGFVLGRNFNIVISMSKARKYGWTG